LETENTESKDGNVMAGWQPYVDSEPVKDDEWSDTDHLGKGSICSRSAWTMDLNGHLKAWC
jgi:hypothetical protein